MKYYIADKLQNIELIVPSLGLEQTMIHSIHIVRIHDGDGHRLRPIQMPYIAVLHSCRVVCTTVDVSQRSLSLYGRCGVE